MQKWIAAAAALILVTTTLACNRAGGGAAKPLIGVTLLTEQHAFYKTLEDGLRDEAKAKNLDLVIVACEMDPAKQASQIEDFVARHVAALLVAPCDSSAVAQNLASADAAGIPVFTADIAAHGAKVVSHVASDNVQGGRLAAQALAKFIGDKGDVVIIDQPTVASVQERVRGFDEEMRNHPNIHIVARPGADGQRARAMAAMEDMMQAHPTLAGVFGINDDSALGALSVVEAAGRKDVAIVGYDATDEARAAIARGTALKADVAQDPGQIGRTAIDMIAQHLAGGQVPPVVAVKVGLVTADTVKQ